MHTVSLNNHVVTLALALNFSLGFPSIIHHSCRGKILSFPVLCTEGKRVMFLTMTWGSTTVQTLGYTFKSDFWLIGTRLNTCSLVSGPLHMAQIIYPKIQATSQTRCSKISSSDLRPKAFQWAPYEQPLLPWGNVTKYSDHKVPAAVIPNYRSQHKKWLLQGLSRSSSNTPSPSNKRANVRLRR